MNGSRSESSNFAAIARTLKESINVQHYFEEFS
jgi:hypothetical protein